MDEPWLTDGVVSLVAALDASYQRLLGKALLPVQGGSPQDIARAAFEMPTVLLCHDGLADPVYRYGNRAALQLWEMTWEELTHLPSRLCAEPMHQDQRNRFLAEVRERGYSEGYSGVRISKTGRRFLIKDVCCWEVTDLSGRRIGQAAAYRDWTYLESR